MGRCPKPHKFFEKNLIKNLIKLRGLPLNNPQEGRERVGGQVSQGQAPDTPRGIDMGRCPKPHKFFEKNLIKNLIKLRGLPLNNPQEGRERVGASPQTPPTFYKKLDQKFLTVIVVIWRMIQVPSKLTRRDTPIPPYRYRIKRT